jgi:signal transduction histidine kinase/CheY-like chemotaxis protein/HPt (histidine-containing phosphotransfer) domain-containing protein
VSKFFQKLSIRVKLTLITMTACGGAILVACAGFGAYDLLSVRRAMEEAMDTHAAIIADNSTAAISFGDAPTAAGILQSLHAERQIQAAAVYTADNHRLATYARSDTASQRLPDAAPPDGSRFTHDSLEIGRSIMLDGKLIGSVYIRADLGELHSRVRRYTLILLAVMAAATATALVLVFRTQRLITSPILRLAQTARDFTATRDYSLRAPRTSDDEVGKLTDTFNEMLEQMHARDKELAAHRDHLEQEVQRRTQEIVQVNRQLSQERDRAEGASRAKSAFLANMSHEIRTPMTAIVGYADLMLEPDQTLSDRQDCLQVIRRNSRHLLDLINDILDISKIEAGKMTTEPVPTNLPELLADLISLMRPRATAKGLAFALDSAGAVPTRIATDPLRLRQVLMNLLSNAIKFTQAGEIRLRVSVEAIDGRRLLRFDIRDTGIGIADEQMSKLFQSFSQADESMTRRFGGTGLGLVISQRLAQLLGGGISVTSRIGQGSTFTVRIDPGALDGCEMVAGLTEAILPRPQYQPQSAQVKLTGRILLVEDGPDNQRLITLHLNRAGAATDIAENGRIGVERVLRASADGSPYDLILMDMQMPELDGYGATSQLRGRGITVPIIALTAHAMADDREKCISAGCTDYLTKPIEKTQLLQTVAAYLLKARYSDGRGTVNAGSNSSESSVGAGPQAGAAVPASTAIAARAAEPSRSDMLRSTFVNDPDMREVLGEFVSQLPAHVARMESLLAAQSMDELRRAVHQLKGAGGGYGFAPITQFAAAAEQRIKGGDPLDQVAREVNALVALIRQIEGYQPTREAAPAVRPVTPDPAN